MKIDMEIKRSNTFKINLNGKSAGTFEKVSEWEGMVKLREVGGTGIIIAQYETSFVDVLFDGDGMDKAIILKISPSLVPV